MRLHLATQTTAEGRRAVIPYAICLGADGLVRRTLDVEKFVRAKDRCRRCERIRKARLV